MRWTVDWCSIVIVWWMLLPLYHLLIVWTVTVSLYHLLCLLHWRSRSVHLVVFMSRASRAKRVHLTSGVTRVGVTRGGNWWVSPYFFSSETLTTFIKSSPLKVMTFFSCRLLTTPIFPRRLSSVLSKFSHKKILRSCVTPWRVSPGVDCPSLPPLSDATAFNTYGYYRTLIGNPVLEVSVALWPPEGPKQLWPWRIYIINISKMKEIRGYYETHHRPPFIPHKHQSRLIAGKDWVLLYYATHCFWVSYFPVSQWCENLNLLVHETLSFVYGEK